jgi:hypothetical protein
MEPRIIGPLISESPSTSFKARSFNIASVVPKPAFGNTNLSIPGLPQVPRQAQYPRLSSEGDPWSSQHTRDQSTDPVSRPNYSGFLGTGSSYGSNTPSHRQTQSNRGSLNSNPLCSFSVDSGYTTIHPPSSVTLNQAAEQRKSNWGSVRNVYPGTEEFPTMDQEILSSMPNSITGPRPLSSKQFQCSHCLQSLRNGSELKFVDYAIPFEAQD